MTGRIENYAIEEPSASDGFNRANHGPAFTHGVKLTTRRKAWKMRPAIFKERKDLFRFRTDDASADIFPSVNERKRAHPVTSRLFTRAVLSYFALFGIIGIVDKHHRYLLRIIESTVYRYFRKLFEIQSRS